MAEEYEYICDDDILCGVNAPKDEDKEKKVGK